jgi:hypothetical protein
LSRACSAVTTLRFCLPSQSPPLAPLSIPSAPVHTVTEVRISCTLLFQLPHKVECCVQASPRRAPPVQCARCVHVPGFAQLRLHVPNSYSGMSRLRPIPWPGSPWITGQEIKDSSWNCYPPRWRATLSRGDVLPPPALRRYVASAWSGHFPLPFSFAGWFRLCLHQRDPTAFPGLNTKH